MLYSQSEFHRYSDYIPSSTRYSPTAIRRYLRAPTACCQPGAPREWGVKVSAVGGTKYACHSVLSVSKKTWVHVCT